MPLWYLHSFLTTPNIYTCTIAALRYNYLHYKGVMKHEHLNTFPIENYDIRTSNILYNVCVIKAAISVNQVDVNIQFTLQCQWFRLMWISSWHYNIWYEQSSSQNNVNGSDWCELLDYFLAWVIQAHVTDFLPLQCQWYKLCELFRSTR